MTRKPQRFVAPPAVTTPDYYIDPHATCYQFARSGSVVLTIKFNPFRIEVADGIEMDEAAALFIAEIKRQTGQE